MSSASPARVDPASSALTRDGVAYRIRAIRPDDLERERAFIAGLSAQSRYNRLMHVMREPSAQFLRGLVDVDYDESMALVATLDDEAGGGERIIGVARYATDAPGSGEAEFAVTVADAWQGRGIGTTLLRALLRHARAQGIGELRGTILATNPRMLELARNLGMTLQALPGDAAIVEARRATTTD